MKLWIRRIVVALVWSALFGFGTPETSGEPPADPFQAPFEKMSGRELVQQLGDDRARSRAFYEIYRRSFKDDAFAQSLGYSDAGYELFLQGCYGAKATIVPQRGGALPLYLVVYGGFDRSWPRRRPDAGKYRVPGREELFPPIAAPPQQQPDERYRSFHVFSSEGKMLRLFADETFSDESFANLTGDGRLGYVEVENCGLENAEHLHIRTLRVATVEETPRTLLNLLLNWNADDWTHRIRDTNGDGISEIEIGPRTARGIKPMVVFRWNQKTETFASSKLGKSDHFRLLPNDWEEANASMDKFRKAKLRFSPTPGAISEEDARIREAKAETHSGPDENFPNRLPADFWTLTPKAAALSFADTNRTTEHRNRFRLAVEDRDGAEPPRNGSVAMTEHTQGCTGPRDAAWFLRIDPEDSYLVTNDWRDPWGGLGHRNPQVKRVPYEKAQQIGAVLWWLDRVRTHPEDLEPPIGFSTTSRDWWLAIQDADGILALGRAETCSYPGWNGTFTRKVYLEYAAWLFRHALLPPGEPAEAQDQPPPLPDRTSDDHSLSETARELLTWWTPDEKRISHTLTTSAVHVVAGTRDVAILGLLRKIADRLPRETESDAAGSDSLEAQFERVEKDVRDCGMAFFQPLARSEFPALDETFTALEEKRADIAFRYDAKKAVAELRQAVDAAFAKSREHTEDVTGRRK